MKRYSIVQMPEENGVTGLYLADLKVEVGDEVYNFPDPKWNLRFKVDSMMAGYDDMFILEYIEHPLGRFIGNKREWYRDATFILLSKITSSLKWLKAGMVFDEHEVKLSRKGEVVAVKCPICEEWHRLIGRRKKSK